MMRVVSFKLDEDLLELLERHAERRNTTKSEIIRRALNMYFSSFEGRSKPFTTKRIRIW